MELWLKGLSVRFTLSQVLKKAVYSYMKGTLIRRRVMARLHLFPDEVLWLLLFNSFCTMIMSNTQWPFIFMLYHCKYALIEVFGG